MIKIKFKIVHYPEMRYRSLASEQNRGLWSVPQLAVGRDLG